MKECPHCHTCVFDEMTYCFECMKPVEVLQQSALKEQSLQDEKTVYVAARKKYLFEVVGPLGEHEKVPLDSTSLSVGRGAGCDICLGDPTVSRDHLRIYMSEGRVYAEDRQASNPTFVNGEPLLGCVEITEGDRIDVRGTILILTSI